MKRRAVCLSLVSAAGLVLAGPLGGAAQVIELRRLAGVSFDLRPVGPDVPNAGRINSIAIHPTREETILVGSESGGLFLSLTGGRTFTPIFSFPTWFVRDVAYYPSDPNVVIATTGRDHSADGSGGGIWRSGDGGITWSKPATAEPPSGAGCLAGAAAWKLSFEPGTPRVLAATECGIARSEDGGQTWSHFPFPWAPFAAAYEAVHALGGGRVVVAGPAGVQRSEDGGSSWRAPALSSVGSVRSFQALAGSPYDAREVYVVNDRFELHVSHDSGATWGPLPTPAGGGGGCGGFEFVRTAPRDRRGFPFLPPELPGLDIYFGNRCGLYRSHARRPLLGRGGLRYSGSWRELNLDHADTRDLQFYADGRPAFLATDGGFHDTADSGDTWRFSGGARRGLNALQLYEVAGQQLGRPRRHDLYVGTQDNNLWSSEDGGASWPHTRVWEGFSFALEPHVERVEDAYVNYKTCGPCVSFISEPHFREERNWPDPLPEYSDPVLVGPGVHVQNAGPTEDAPRPFGLELTDDFGARWRTAVRDYGGRQTAQLPRVSRYGADPVLYQAYRDTSDAAGNLVFKLARVTAALRSGGPVAPVFPRMDGFGGLGVHTTMFVWRQVWGVDPQDPMHLIAADVGNDSMMRSLDGGNTWVPLTELTELMTKGGALKFTDDRGEYRFSLASSVGFSPQDPTLVLVGAAQGGLYFSGDRGRSWRFVPGSEKLPKVTRFHWQSTSTVFVSTYGRGLWKLDLGLRYERPSFEPLCTLCGVFDLEGRQLPIAFDRALLAFDGSLSDARVEQGALAHWAVTPGASTRIFSSAKQDPYRPPEEAAEPGSFEGLAAAAKLAGQGQVIRGLTFSEGAVNGIIASAKEEPWPEPGSFLQFSDDGDPTPADPGKPYVEIFSGDMTAGVPAALPDGVLELIGRGFSPEGERLELRVDGRLLKRRVPVKGSDGGFHTRIKLRRLGLLHGVHSVSVEQRIGEQTLRDVAPFGVRHDDSGSGQPQPDDDSDSDSDNDDSDDGDSDDDDSDDGDSDDGDEKPSRKRNSGRERGSSRPRSRG